MPSCFPVCYLCKCCLSPSECMFTRGPSSSIHNSVFKLFIHSAFLLSSFRSYVLLQNLLAALKHDFGMVSTRLPLIIVKILFVVLECPVWSCLGIFLVCLLSLVFLFVFSSFIFRSSRRTFNVSSEHLLIIHFGILACCRCLFYLQFKSEFPP